MFSIILSLLTLTYKLVDALGNAEFLLQKLGMDESAATFLGSSRFIDLLVVVSLILLVVSLVYQVNRYAVVSQQAASSSTAKSIPPQPDTAPVESTALPPKDFLAKLQQEEAVKRTERLEKRVNELGEELDKYRWLISVAKNDLDQIQKAVFVKTIYARVEIVEGKIPYVDFVFEIYNVSVYQIAIDYSKDALKGYITFRNEELSGNKRIVTGEREWENCTNCLSRGKCGFIVRQWLSDADARVIRESREGSAFQFDNLEIMIIGGDKCPDVVPRQLKIDGYVSKLEEGNWWYVNPPTAFP